MIQPGCRKILSNGLRWTAEELSDSIKVRSIRRSCRPQVEQRLYAGYGGRTGRSVRNESDGGLVQTLSVAFVIRKDEGLLFLQRPSQGSSELVALKGRSGTLV